LFKTIQPIFEETTKKIISNTTNSTNGGSTSSLTFTDTSLKFTSQLLFTIVKLLLIDRQGHFLNITAYICQAVGKIG